MKLISLLLCLNFFGTNDTGEYGRYRVEIKTTQGQQLKAYITISTYDALKTEFETDELFKEFLFSLYGYEHLDSLDFCRQLRYLNYPHFDNKEEKLLANLDRDWLRIAKADIEQIKFLSFKDLGRVILLTELTAEEIRLFQKEPFYVGTFSIAPKVESFTGLWILSYNKDLEEPEVTEIMEAMQEAYLEREVEGEVLENFKAYEELLLIAQVKLKDYGVYLIRVAVM